MNLFDDNLFLTEQKINRALAFWGNISVALHRLIDDLDHETGKWMTLQDNEAVKVLLTTLKTAQTIIYNNYRECISKKIEIINHELDLDGIEAIAEKIQEDCE